MADYDEDWENRELEARLADIWEAIEKESQVLRHDPDVRDEGRKVFTQTLLKVFFLGGVFYPSAVIIPTIAWFWIDGIEVPFQEAAYVIEVMWGTLASGFSGWLGATRLPELVPYYKKEAQRRVFEKARNGLLEHHHVVF